jgi:hypothetical protein
VGRAASHNKKATDSVAFLLCLRRAIRGSLFAHTCAHLRCAWYGFASLAAATIPLAKPYPQPFPLKRKREAWRIIN